MENLNYKRVEKDKGASSIIKRWVRLCNDENGSNYVCHLNVSTPQIGKEISFSVGDCWPSNIDGVISFYKVTSVEDVIIPAGRYRCYNLCEEMKDGKKNHYWFASDIGLVKFDIGGIKGSLQGFSKE